MARGLAYWSALLFLAATPAASAESDVHALLTRLASAIRDRYVHGYTVTIDRWERFTPHFGFALGGTMRDAPPAPRVRSHRSGVHDQIVLSRLGRRFRYTLRNIDNEVWEWLTDGTQVWCYRRDRNIFTLKPQEPWPDRLGPVPGLPGVEWKYITKFIAIADMADRSRILSDDLAPTAECPGPSTVIAIDIADGDEPWREELRVLTSTGLPCTTAIHRTRRLPRSGPTDMEETISWTFVDGPPDPSTFHFSPRSYARQVKRIPR